jgi:hypothetical protein
MGRVTRTVVAWRALDKPWSTSFCSLARNDCYSSRIFHSWAIVISWTIASSSTSWIASRILSWLTILQDAIGCAVRCWRTAVANTFCSGITPTTAAWAGAATCHSTRTSFPAERDLRTIIGAWSTVLSSTITCRSGAFRWAEWTARIICWAISAGSVRTCILAPWANLMTAY